MIIFLYYKFNLIVKILSIVFGIKIFRNNKNRFSYVTLYYGIISGLMVGYLFRKGYLMCLIVSLIVPLACFAVQKTISNGEDIILLMITVFCYSYLISKLLLKKLKIDFYDILDKYPDLEGDYLNYDYTILIAVIITLLIGAIIFAVKGNIKKTMVYRFIAIMMFLGSLAAHTRGDFEITGEWQDLFLPWLNIEYGEKQFVYTYIIIVISCILVIYDLYIENDEKLEKID